MLLEVVWVEVKILKEKNKFLEEQLQEILQKNFKLSEEVSLFKGCVIR